MAARRDRPRRKAEVAAIRVQTGSTSERVFRIVAGLVAVGVAVVFFVFVPEPWGLKAALAILIFSVGLLLMFIGGRGKRRTVAQATEQIGGAIGEGIFQVILEAATGI